MEMADICRRHEIDLLIPSVDEELVVLARGVGELLPTRLMLPRLDYVTTMLDKLSMIEALKARNIRVPKSMTLAEDFSGIPFPCIAKPRSGRGSRGVRTLPSAAEAMVQKSIAGTEADKTLLQAKIEGDEYTVQMLADQNGRLSAVVPVRVGVKRGITIRAETENEPQVILACRLIHEGFPTSGCYNIQLIRTSSGDVLPFEINPRISTTLCLTVAAGIDPIATFLGQRQAESLQSFASGIKLQRHWTNYFSRVIEL
jgi:carbamoyl-phosphate synthase large subunit